MIENRIIVSRQKLVSIQTMCKEIAPGNYEIQILLQLYESILLSSLLFNCQPWTCIRKSVDTPQLQNVQLKGELQCKNKLISYARVFKMLDNDMYIVGIGQAVLELLSFKVGSGNHQRQISLLQTFSEIFGNMRLIPLKMTSHLTSHNFQILRIEIFSKLCKI